MERIAAALTDYLVEKNAIFKDDYEIYKYGFLTGIEMLICIVICFFIAIRMDMIDIFCVFFLVFFSLRSFVGGFHMNSYVACLFCSCIVFYIMLLSVKYYPIDKNYSIILSGCEIILIYYMNPVENINRPVDENEKILFTQRIHQILIIISLVIIVMYVVNSCDYLTTITYTLTIVIISMFLGKMKNYIFKI